MSTYKDNPPQITLIAHTPDPLSVLYEVWQRARDYPILRKGHPLRRADEVELFRKLIFDYTQIPEMVSFTWWFEGVPRAFFDQVVRHRKTSMFARSQRVRDQQAFATKGEYLTTTRLLELEDGPVSAPGGGAVARSVYDGAMRDIQTAYETLIALGIPIEDARGILPLHLRTGFAWGTSLRDLAECFRIRTCHLLQQEYWGPVMREIRAHLVAIDPELDVIFAPPCKREGKCVSTFDAQIRADAVIAGKPVMDPCRIWSTMFAADDIRAKLDDAVDAGTTRWAKSPFEY